MSPTNVISPSRVTGKDPRDCYARWYQQHGGADGLLLVEFDLEQYWLPEPGRRHLTAAYLREGGRLRIAVTDSTLQLDQRSGAEQFEEWLEALKLCAVSPDQPMFLSPRYIPKPWGQEIWFTGVEQRGVCGFGAPGAETPIPWLQAALPDEAAGSPGEPLVLLKILDPATEPVTGDLYFELHEEKREVYVVTRVDPRAWPDGVGYIRYGFDPGKVAEAGSEQLFREIYLAAVERYEAVRRELDALPQDAPVDADLEQLERELRAGMEAFTHMRPLSVGDVVVVPLLLPHSLQHGVRTVEFQTPVYERQILSFAQKVLTQDHWDTAHAVSLMQLLPPEPEPFLQLHSAPGVTVEQIVDFPDFEVRRVQVAAGEELQLPPLEHYGVLMVVDGELALAGGCAGPEQALLLPREWAGRVGPREGSGALVFLLALPRR
jgi:hypothetical protein